MQTGVHTVMLAHAVFMFGDDSAKKSSGLAGHDGQGSGIDACSLWQYYIHRVWMAWFHNSFSVAFLIVKLNYYFIMPQEWVRFN